MKENKLWGLLPYILFAVALFFGCGIVEAVTVMMWTKILLMDYEIDILKDKMEALEEAATSPKAE